VVLLVPPWLRLLEQEPVQEGAEAEEAEERPLALRAPVQGLLKPELNLRY
jgi:hypothetical protein